MFLQIRFVGCRHPAPPSRHPRILASHKLHGASRGVQGVPFQAGILWLKRDVPDSAKTAFSACRHSESLLAEGSIWLGLVLLFCYSLSLSRHAGPCGPGSKACCRLSAFVLVSTIPSTVANLANSL